MNHRHKQLVCSWTWNNCYSFIFIWFVCHEVTCRAKFMNKFERRGWSTWKKRLNTHLTFLMLCNAFHSNALTSKSVRKMVSTETAAEVPSKHRYHCVLWFASLEGFYTRISSSALVSCESVCSMEFLNKWGHTWEKAIIKFLTLILRIFSWPFFVLYLSSLNQHQLFKIYFHFWWSLLDIFKT